MNARRIERPAMANPAVAGAALSRLETAIESVVGNRLGAGVYRRWVASLGLRGGERVLEVGTGAGACARHLASALPSGHLTCLDIDPRWLEIARRRLAAFESRVDFVCADVCHLSCPGEFDVGIAHFVLHDIQPCQRKAALRGIIESLRPGGVLHVREPLEHGMTAEELIGGLEDAGFAPAMRCERGRVPLMGEVLSGSWRA